MHRTLRMRIAGVAPTPGFLQGMGFVLASIFLYSSSNIELPNPFKRKSV